MASYRRKMLFGLQLKAMIAEWRHGSCDRMGVHILVHKPESQSTESRRSFKFSKPNSWPVIASSGKGAPPKSLEIAPPVEIKYPNPKQGVPFTEAGIASGVEIELNIRN